MLLTSMVGSTMMKREDLLVDRCQSIPLSYLVGVGTTPVEPILVDCICICNPCSCWRRAVWMSRPMGATTPMVAEYTTSIRRSRGVWPNMQACRVASTS